MFDAKKIGDNLKTLREDAGMTQRQLAAIRHVSQATITNQELGKRAVGEETLYWYAEYFNVTTDWILGLAEQQRTNAKFPQSTKLDDTSELTPKERAAFRKLLKDHDLET